MRQYICGFIFLVTAIFNNIKSLVTHIKSVSMTTQTTANVIRKCLFIFWISLSISCAKKQHEARVNYIMRGDTIILTDQSAIKTKIKLEQAKVDPYLFEMITAGKVKAIPNYYAEIAPPFAGRVTKVLLKLGMRVHPGTPLFEMNSSDFIDAQKVYFQSKSEFEAASLMLKRQEDLNAHGVGAVRDLEEAQTNFKIKQKDYQKSIASLKIFNVNIDDLVFGQPLIMPSPIEGEVVDNQVVLGQYIKDSDPPRAIVVQLNKVWVAGQVKEKDIHLVHTSDKAEIRAAAYPTQVVDGKIYHINEIVDEVTRSVQVLIECENINHVLKPGMYVTVKFIDAPTSAVFIQTNSLLQYNDKSFVFVNVGKDRYLKRFVKVGEIVKDRIIVTEGLLGNETVVAQGGYYLLEAK